MRSLAKIFNATDPTRTIVLRQRFIQDFRNRFNALKSVITESIVENDCFALKDKPEKISDIIRLESLKDEKAKLKPAKVREFEFSRNDQKVNGFMGWLKGEEKKGVLEIIQMPDRIGVRAEQPWTNTYIRSAYQKGLAKGHADLIKAGADIPPISSIPGGVSTAFYQPFHVEAVALVYTRTYNELIGITSAMDQQISRHLAEGLITGQGPYQIASKINDRVDKIGISRAQLLARTETAHAFNTATISEFAQAEKIIGEKVLCQWQATLDSRTRPQHIIWHGEVFTREEAEGMLGEPNCRCTVLPYIKSLQKDK